MLLAIIGLFNLFFYWKLSLPANLTFSDGAKIADIARNITLGNGYGGYFSSFGADKDILSHLELSIFPRFDRQPLMSFFMSLVFKLFGVNDLSVIITSTLFYLLTIIVLFLLVSKIVDQKLGFIVSLAFMYFLPFWEYSLNGASETLFTLEVVLSLYFLSFNNKKVNILGLLVAITSYFTRPQGFILIAVCTLLFILNNFKFKKAIAYFFLILVSGILVDLFLFSRFTNKSYFYSVINKGVDVSVMYTSVAPATTKLRGYIDSAEVFNKNLLVVLKKSIYNMYNFYKLMPEILSPYIFSFFIASLFVKEKSRKIAIIKYLILLTLILFIIFASLSIPFFRYIHPLVPLVYLFGIKFIYDYLKERTIWIVLFLIVFQALGVIFLDSRFIKNTKNINLQSIYVLLSKQLQLETTDKDVIATNIDTWGSWYGERRTVLLPDDTKLVDNSGFTHVYITSYKINDENYLLNDSWKVVLDNPEHQEVLNNFKLVKKFEFETYNNYENEFGYAVLLKKIK